MQHILINMMLLIYTNNFANIGFLLSGSLKRLVLEYSFSLMRSNDESMNHY